MSDVIKIGGYILFAVLMVALFKEGKPDLTFGSPGLGVGLGTSLAMIAIGYLGDVVDILRAMHNRNVANDTTR